MFKNCFRGLCRVGMYAALVVALICLWKTVDHFRKEGNVVEELRSAYRVFQWAIVAGIASALFGSINLFDVSGRSKDRHHWTPWIVIATGILAIAASITSRKLVVLRAWSFQLVYEYDFKEMSRWEYDWCVGHQRWLDVSSAKKLSFATSRSRDSGAFDLWRLRIAESSLQRFLESNSKWPDHPKEGVAIANATLNDLPDGWQYPSANIAWWKPQLRNRSGLRVFRWVDRHGTIVAYGVYDEASETFWIR